jgi:hypothetical protein
VPLNWYNAGNGEINRRDGCFIPASARHRWFNTTGRLANA